MFFGVFQKSTPAILQTILGKLLAIRTAHRYHAIEEFLCDWEEFRNSIQRPVESLEKEKSISIHAKKRSFKILIAAVAVIVVILLIFIFLK